MHLAASTMSRAQHGGLLLSVFIVADHHRSSPTAGLGACTLRGYELALQQLQRINHNMSTGNTTHTAP